jgi:hypothetical protein
MADRTFPSSHPDEESRVLLRELADLIAQPSLRGFRHLHKVGGFAVLEPARLAEPEPGRWQTLLIYQNHFALLVDEFRADSSASWALTLEAPEPLTGGRRRYRIADAGGPLALHPLGDYPTEARGRTLTLRQRLGRGRFLIALTRDPDAQARVLNGWAVEIRSGGRIYHILHSNRTRRLRPLGPVQTDAEFALADWPRTGELPLEAGTEPNLHLLHAAQVVWGDQCKLTAESAVNLWYQVSADSPA